MMGLSWLSILSRIIKEAGLLLATAAAILCTRFLWGSLAVRVVGPIHPLLMLPLVLGVACALAGVLEGSEFRRLVKQSAQAALCILVCGWALLVLAFLVMLVGPPAHGDQGIGAAFILFGLGIGTPLVALAWGSLRFAGCSTVSVLERFVTPETSSERASGMRMGICFGLAALFIAVPLLKVHVARVQWAIMLEAESTGTSPERLRELFSRHRSDTGISYALSRNSATPLDVLEEMVSSKHPSMGGVLMNENAPCTLLIAVADAQPWAVSSYAQWSPHRPMPDYVSRYLRCKGVPPETGESDTSEQNANRKIAESHGAMYLEGRDALLKFVEERSKKASSRARDDKDN